LLINSMCTQLIHAQQWARRSRKRMGSVACWERRGRGVTRSQSSASTSRVRLKCSLEDETRWGMFLPQCHTVTEMAFRFCVEDVLKPLLQSAARHTLDDKDNGVESQPNHDEPLHSVNAGLSTQVAKSPERQRSSNITQCRPVMGSAISSRSMSWSGFENKFSAMKMKPQHLGGKWSSFCNWPINLKGDS